MSAMHHSALMGMTFDPRSGVVADHKSVYLLMKNSDFVDIKNSVVMKLNSNMNKFYPDAGGILMGYQGIKLKKSTSEVTAANTSLLHPVHIRVQFFLFKPLVGSELQCVVKEREDGLVTCLAHGIFRVLVVHPPKAWETVFVGQVVVVKVDAVEQLAWQEPLIAASLLEVSDNINSPFIDIVDNFDNDDEVETMTDSGMFEHENNHLIRDRSRAQATVSSNSVGRDNSGSPQLSKKRKINDESNVDTAEVANSPVKKKRKSSKITPVVEPPASESVLRNTRHSSKSSVDSETSPTSQSSSSEQNIDKLCPPHTHPVTPSPAEPQPSTSTTSMPPSLELPSPNKKQNSMSSPGKTKQKSRPSPQSSSPAKEKQKSMLSPGSSSPSKKKNSSKLLTKILPKPLKMNSADSGNDTDADENEALDEDNPQNENTIAENTTNTADSTGEAFLCKISALTASETLVSEPAPPSPSKSGRKPKSGKDMRCPPPGFTDNTANLEGKKRRVNLTGPTGEKFTSYVSAWEWFHKHPQYIAKEEVTVDRELPNAVIENQLDSVEITPVADESETTEKLVPESPKNKSKHRKPPKKFIPTPVSEAISKKQSKQQRVPDSTEEVPESQNLLNAETESLDLLTEETEYQSQSLLQPEQTVSLNPKSSKVADDEGRHKKVVAESKKGLSKSESSGKGDKSVPLSKTSVDAGQTSSTENSDSSDNSDAEENPTQVTIPVKQTEAPRSPPSSDSSSYDSDSSDDEQTVRVAKTPTRPSEAVASKPDESSDSSSDSDSSEESPKTAENTKSNNFAVAKGPLSVLTPSGDKDTKKVVAQIKGKINTTKKQSSSSSSSDSEEENLKSVPKKKKIKRIKISPKASTSQSNKVSTSIMDDKSPHLSSTVVSGVERLKNKMSVPDGISPILKSKHKSKAPVVENSKSKPPALENSKSKDPVVENSKSESASKENNSSVFDDVMANSKIGFQSSENVQTGGIEGAKSDKNSNVKEDKNIKNDKNANKKNKKKKAPPGFL